MTPSIRTSATEFSENPTVLAKNITTHLCSVSTMCPIAVNEVLLAVRADVDLSSLSPVGIVDRLNSPLLLVLVLLRSSCSCDDDDDGALPASER